MKSFLLWIDWKTPKVNKIIYYASFWMTLIFENYFFWFAKVDFIILISGPVSLRRLEKKFKKLRNFRVNICYKRASDHFMNKLKDALSEIKTIVKKIQVRIAKGFRRLRTTSIAFNNGSHWASSVSFQAKGQLLW